jgi:lysophospholipase L1-like esterase
MRKSIPGVRVVGALMTPTMGGKNRIGSEEVNRNRIIINHAMRSVNIFDAYLNFEQAVLDPESGALKPEYVPNSTIGGPGDHVHPNRAGYMAIANSIHFDVILPKTQTHPYKR